MRSDQRLRSVRRAPCILEYAEQSDDLGDFVWSVEESADVLTALLLSERLDDEVPPPVRSPRGACPGR